MSFGRPPTSFISTVLPPAKGSFPLDHEAECKEAMMEYMACMKSNRNNNGACRHLSQKYLECRMDRNLMERESLPNLGFGEAQMDAPPSQPASAASPGGSGPRAAASAPASSNAAGGKVETNKAAAGGRLV